MYNREIVFRFPGKDIRFFSSSKGPDHLRYSAQPHIQWVMREFTCGVKRQGLETNHSPSSPSEVKKRHTYTHSVFLSYAQLVLQKQKTV
jgi:hypothetical protein